MIHHQKPKKKKTTKNDMMPRYSVTNFEKGNVIDANNNYTCRSQAEATSVLTLIFFSEDPRQKTTRSGAN